MIDHKISAGFAGAAMLWFVGFGLIVTDLFVRHVTLGNLGIGLCCGGAVLMIRCMMCRATNHLERTVFNLGREVGQAEATRDIPLQRIH